VDHLTSGGKLHSPTQQRVFWALMEGVIAAVLLVGGGLATLQAASVSTGLLFACVILVGVYSLYVGFSQEIYVENSVQKAVNAARDDHQLQRAVSLAAEDNT
jgi:choline-glycine betaine transporter